MRVLLTIVSVVYFIAVNFTNATETECKTRNDIAGKCVLPTECQTVIDAFEDAENVNHRLLMDVMLSHCDKKINQKICCPDKKKKSSSTERESLLPDKCGYPSVNVAITNGESAKTNEYPWMVRLELKAGSGERGYILCGGTLINKRYVLTAAHCSDKFNLQYQANAVLGLTNIYNDEPSVLTVSIEKVIIHENYIPDQRTPIYDISLLRLAEDVEFTNEIHPICLPSNDFTFEDVELEITGWGSTDSAEDAPDLRKAEVSLFDHDTCKENYKEENYNIRPFMLCAAGENGKDTCTGDSGGPLMARNSLGRFSIIGVVSFGHGCGKPDFPGIYTDVKYFLPWILENMEP